LTVAQVVDALPDGLVTIDFERLKKGTARILDAEALIQHEQRIGNGIDDTLRLNVTNAQKPVKVFRIHQEQAYTESTNAIKKRPMSQSKRMV
jgi:hypothetical protein